MYGILLTLIGASCYGMLPYFTKRLIDLGISNTIILVGRFCIIALWMALYFLFSKGLKKPNFKLVLHMFAFASIGYGGAIILLTESYRYIPISQGTMLHFTYPLFAAIFMIVFFKEKLTKYKLGALILSIISLFCFMKFEISYEMHGIFLAVASGALFGMYLVSVDKSQLKTLDPANLMFYLSVSIIITFTVFEIIRYGSAKINWIGINNFQVIYNLSMIAAFSLVGTLLVTIGIRKIGATYAAILSVMEPVVSYICGLLVYKEPLEPYSFAGSALMLVVILLIVFDEKNRRHLKITTDN